MIIRLFRLFQVPLKAAWFILVTKRQFPEFLCTCVLRSTGQRRFQCSYEDAFHPGSISTSSAVPINKKKRWSVESRRCYQLARRRYIWAARWETRRWAGAGGTGVSDGGESVLGRSVQRKEEQAAVWGLNSTSLFSPSTGICLFGSRLCPVQVIG